ncbi:protein phosphatase PPM8, putative [Plasmodium ovale wallikeri]|uniref:Protein phosphatase PPM8, putative n=1 Tax=Plasmodium ovale wallikeri TaxID=864142 RepID=A0A1A8YX08_PLAOA|nr:protein phosphatase PPM8, putative [Plasmodium ovale wallikeri]
MLHKKKFLLLLAIPILAISIDINYVSCNEPKQPSTNDSSTCTTSEEDTSNKNVNNKSKLNAHSVKPKFEFLEELNNEFFTWNKKRLHMIQFSANTPIQDRCFVSIIDMRTNDFEQVDSFQGVKEKEDKAFSLAFDNYVKHYLHGLNKMQRDHMLSEDMKECVDKVEQEYEQFSGEKVALANAASEVTTNANSTSESTSGKGEPCEGESNADTDADTDADANTQETQTQENCAIGEAEGEGEGQGAETYTKGGVSANENFSVLGALESEPKEKAPQESAVGETVTRTHEIGEHMETNVLQTQEEGNTAEESTETHTQEGTSMLEVKHEPDTGLSGLHSVNEVNEHVAGAPGLHSVNEVNVHVADPSGLPSVNEVNEHVVDPSGLPSVNEINEHVADPSGLPSVNEVNEPVADPSGLNSVNEVNEPVADPSGLPSVNEANEPVADPSGLPSVNEVNEPVTDPSGLNSVNEVNEPVAGPSWLHSVNEGNVPIAGPSGLYSQKEENEPVPYPSGLSVDLSGLKTQEHVHNKKPLMMSGISNKASHGRGDDCSNNAFLFAAVIDGHGGDILADLVKKWLSFYVKKQLLDKLLKGNKKNLTSSDIVKSLEEAHIQLDNDILKKAKEFFYKGNVKYTRNGACSLSVLMDKTNYYISNVGDSKGLLIRKKSHVRLNNMHNASEISERKRLVDEHKNEDDVVMCKRTKRRGSTKMVEIFNLPEKHRQFKVYDIGRCYVKGRLQCTRTFGDFYLKHKMFAFDYRRNKFLIKEPHSFPYISSNPEIIKIKRSKEDEYIVLVSDGISDHLSDKEIFKIIKQYGSSIKKASKHPDRSKEEVFRRHDSGAHQAVVDRCRCRHKCRRKCRHRCRQRQWRIAIVKIVESRKQPSQGNQRIPSRPYLPEGVIYAHRCLQCCMNSPSNVRRLHQFLNHWPSYFVKKKSVHIFVYVHVMCEHANKLLPPSPPFPCVPFFWITASLLLLPFDDLLTN